MAKSPTDAEYERLANLRAGVRRYLAWAEQCARDHDTTPAQVQLALAIRAHPSADGPTVTELADTLLLRHHSVVGLIDRAEKAGLVERHRDADQQTRVHVTLTEPGREQLATITALHVTWLRQHAGELVDVLASFEQS
jgi:DNA-binding MarR family transcriptional regulator